MGLIEDAMTNLDFMPWAGEPIRLGAVMLVAFSGFVHMLPGPPLAKSAEMLNCSGWFIQLGGVVMVFTALIHEFFSRRIGIYLFALTMGGTAGTALGISIPAMRPGSFLFSLSTFLAILYSNHLSNVGGMSDTTILVYFFTFCVGMSARWLIGHPDGDSSPAAVDKKRD